MTLGDIARRLKPTSPHRAGRAPGLSADGWFDTKHQTYPYGVQIGQVRIDAETGGLTIERLLAAYDLGLEAGQESGARDIHLALSDDMLDRPLGDTRRTLLIDAHRLRQFYAREREALPGTLASLRLPVAR